MYGIGSDNATFPGSKQAAAGFLQQYASLSDLSSFFTQFDPKGAATPIAIIGPNDQTNPGMEADLDVQYIMSIGAGVNTTYWCVRPLRQVATAAACDAARADARARSVLLPGGECEAPCGWRRYPRVVGGAEAQS
jgi:hypothetical protein